MAQPAEAIPYAAPPESAEMTAAADLQAAVIAVQRDGDVLDVLAKPRRLLPSLTTGLLVAGSLSAVAESEDMLSFRPELIPDAVANYTLAVCAVAGLAKVAGVIRRSARAERAWRRQVSVADVLDEPAELLRIPINDDKRDVHLHWGLRRGETPLDPQVTATRLKRLASTAEEAGISTLLVSRSVLPADSLPDDAPALTLTEALAAKGKHGVRLKRETEPEMTALSPKDAIAIADGILERAAQPNAMSLVQDALRQSGAQRTLLYTLIGRYQAEPSAQNSRRVQAELRHLLEGKLFANETIATNFSAAGAGPADRATSHSQSARGTLLGGQRVLWHTPGHDPEYRNDLRHVLHVTRTLPDVMRARGAAAKSTVLTTALVTAWEALTTGDESDTIADADTARLLAPNTAPDNETTYLVQDAARKRLARNTEHRLTHHRDRRTPEGLARGRRSWGGRIGASALSLTLGLGIPAAVHVGYEHARANAVQAFETKYAKDHGFASTQDLQNAPYEDFKAYEHALNTDPSLSIYNAIDDTSTHFQIDETNAGLRMMARLGIMPDQALINEANKLVDRRKESMDPLESDIGNAGTDANQPLWTIETHGMPLPDSEGHYAMFSSSRLCATATTLPGQLGWGMDDISHADPQPHIVPLKEASTIDPALPRIVLSIKDAAGYRTGLSLPVLDGYTPIALEATSNRSQQPVPVEVRQNMYGEYYVIFGGDVGDTHDVTMTLAAQQDAGIQPGNRSPQSCEFDGYNELTQAQVRADLRATFEKYDPALLQLHSADDIAAYIRGHFTYAVNPLQQSDLDYISSYKPQNSGGIQINDVPNPSAATYDRLVQTLYKRGKLNCNLATTLLALANEANGLTDPLVVVNGFLNSNNPNDPGHQYLSTNEAHLYAVRYDPATKRTVIVDPTPGTGISDADQQHFKEQYSASDFNGDKAATVQHQRRELAEDTLLLALLSLAGAGAYSKRYPLYGYGLRKHLEVADLAASAERAVASAALGRLVARDTRWLAAQDEESVAVARELIDTALYSRSAADNSAGAPAPFAGTGRAYRGQPLETLVTHLPTSLTMRQARTVLRPANAPKEIETIAARMMARQRHDAALARRRA